MRHAEMIDEQPVLGVDHVGVVIARKVRAQPCARAAGRAVPDAVGEDDVVDGGVERLAAAVQLVGERRAEELGSRARGAVENEHRVAHHAARIALRRAEGAVMDGEGIEPFAVGEGEVANDEVAGDAGRRGALGTESRPEEREDSEGGEEWLGHLRREKRGSNLARTRPVRPAGRFDHGSLAVGAASTKLIVDSPGTPR